MHRKTIMVLGMHRSGTSAVARMLNLLGSDLPRTLMPEAPSNPKGHWESNAIMELNDAILRSGGSSWHDWQQFNPTWYESPVVSDFMQRASIVLHEEYGTSHLFVLKDPRNCRLIRFWLDVLKDADVQPLVVIPLRNPLEVADSLEARDGMHRDFALLLWLRHVLDAEYGSRKCCRVFLTYDNVLEDWAEVVERMQSTFGITWPRCPANIAREMESFLDRGSRHHDRSEKSVRSNLTVSEWVRDADAILRRWAESTENSDDYPILDKIRMQLNAASPAFANLVHDASSERYQNNELRAFIKAKDEEVEKLKNEISHLSHMETELRNSYNEIKNDGNAFQERILKLEAEKSSIESDLLALREHAKIIEANLDNSLAEKGEREASLRIVQNDLEKNIEELSDYKNKLIDLQSTLRQREEEIAQTIKSLDEKQIHLDNAENAKNKIANELELANKKIAHANAWVFKIAGEKREVENKSVLMESRLNDTQRSLDSVSLKLKEVKSRYLSPSDRFSLLQNIDNLKASVAKLRIERDGANQNVEAARAEVLALSRLLQQRDTDSISSVSEQAKAAAREHELVVSVEGLRIQNEQAKRESETAKLEVLALSRIVQQLQAELIDSSSEKVQAAAHENELAVLVEDLRVQNEHAKRESETAKMEVLALSRILQQRQADMIDMQPSSDVVRLSSELRDKEEAVGRYSNHASWLQEVNGVVTGYPHWWAFVPKKIREKWQNGRLLRRGLFDADSYLARYPDVLSSGINPLRHYIIHGIGEKRTF